MNMHVIEIDRLKPNPDNLFTPLSGSDYEELKESIQLSGVLEPLMVARENGHFKVLCGHNRLRVAQELGIGELPCLLVDNELEEAVSVDTELFRRHLSSEEKSNFIKIRDERYTSREKKELNEKLHPELLKLRNEGKLPNVAMVMKMTIEEQGALVLAFTKEVIKEVEVEVEVEKEVKTGVDPKEVAQAKKELKTLQEENARLNETLVELKTEVTGKEAEVKKIQKAAADLKVLHDKKLEALVLDLENARADADGSIQQDHQEELEERRLGLVAMSKTVEERQTQIDKLKEDIAKLKDQVMAKEGDAKASLMASMNIKDQLKKERDRYANPALLQRRLDTIVAELDTLLDHVIHYSWDETVLQATEKSGETIKAKLDKLVGKIQATFVPEDSVTKGQLKMVK